MITLATSSVPTVEPEPLVPRPRRDFLTPVPDISDEYLLVLDNTAMEKILLCQRSAFFYLVEGREAHAKNAALTFGGAIHKGLEVFHHGKSADESDEAFFGRIAAAVSQYFTENPPPPDEYRTVSNAVEVLRYYITRSSFPDYELTIYRDADGACIERGFELPLTVLDINADITLPIWDAPRFVRRIHVAWSGRIDLIATLNGIPRVVDHKTSSIDGDAFTQSFHLSNQVIGYTWAGRQLWPELDLHGFGLNCIRFKRPTGSGPINAPGPRGGEPALKFFRAYFEYTPERLEEWRQNTITVITDFVYSVVRGVFPYNASQCFHKYGRCQYHDVCLTENPAVRRALLHSDLFKPVTWNPLA